MLEQPGDYTESEWIGMEWWSGLFGGKEQGLWAEGLQLVSGSYSDVHGYNKQIVYAT